ncbi:hypothetical protein CLOSTMETH_03247 [[Clostridium] methylpentosum DSM 5476]|uniref:Uncharacterized protein n=1 Tax=[Clostridium] methylpentosum DSM 5476 TaxID=537013 RepID=C0EH47_9FIRM|nr:hypothetical protein CLOSTMETH_03247 [[Clostridium] methylpentosum DSM 5476]
MSGLWAFRTSRKPNKLALADVAGLYRATAHLLAWRSFPHIGNGADTARRSRAISIQAFHIKESLLVRKQRKFPALSMKKGALDGPSAPLPIPVLVYS